MELADVRVRPGPRILSDTAAVEKAESALWTTLPAGYREYISHLGQGVLSDFVRIYPPAQIVMDLDDWRQRIRRYWFWDDESSILPKTRAMESIVIGDTLNGDELVFHPGKARQLIVLPRDGNAAFDAGSDLFSAIDWMLSSEVLVELETRREFEPVQIWRETSSTTEARLSTSDPTGETLAELEGALQRWARRHAVQTMAEHGLAQFLEEQRTSPLAFVPRKQIEVKKKGVTLWIEPPEMSLGDTGVVVAFDLVDSATNWEIGRFEWITSADPSSIPWKKFTPSAMYWNEVEKRYRKS